MYTNSLIHVCEKQRVNTCILVVYNTGMTELINGWMNEKTDEWNE